MINIVVFSDIPLSSSNKKGTPSGLIFEIIQSIKKSRDFKLCAICVSPFFLSRIYIPINYLIPVVRCWILYIRFRLVGSSIKVLLYPSRLRVLATVLPGSKLCIGPDDTTEVLNSLALSEKWPQNTLRVAEKYLNNYIEKITPYTIAAFVGKKDVQSYLQRNPVHKSYYIPHPLFSADIVPFEEVKSLLTINTSQASTRLIIYGATTNNASTNERLDLLSYFAQLPIFVSKSLSIEVYGANNKWIYDKIAKSCFHLKVIYACRFASFSSLISSDALIVSLSPYPYGTKTRILSALANALPCMCLSTEIPDQVLSIPGLHNHIISFEDELDQQRLLQLFSVQGRLRLATEVRRQSALLDAKSMLNYL